MHGLVCEGDSAVRRNDLEVKLENPLGFFESQRLVEVNETLLDLIGRTWETPPLLGPCWDQAPLLEALQPMRSRLSAYALDQCWVDKDPRLCITYPAYLHILLRRVPLVLALREPLAVATSLYARNGFSLNRGLVIWLLYNHHIAAQLNDDDLVVPYEGLLRMADCEQGLQLQAEIDALLERQGRPRSQPGRWQELLRRFLRPNYNRAGQALSLGSRRQVNPRLEAICRRCFEALQRTESAQQRLEVFREQFETLPRAALEVISRERMLPETEHVHFNSRCHQLEADLQSARAVIDDQNVRLEQQQRQLAALQSSTSWRLTAPMRSIVDRFRGVNAG